jgi:predicted RNA polymerase sigma factor
VPEATVVRRITRAKATLAEVARDPEAASPFDVPDPPERRHRLPAVLHVVYLVFTEGYAATGGDDWLRPELCEEALRLGWLVTALHPGEPEAHGLSALMEFQACRFAARTDADGDPVLLEAQDRARWDRSAIRRGTDSLGRALADGPPGQYALQAAIAACHVRAPSVEDTDWTTVAALYDALATLTPSAVVLLNRAVAHGRADGPVVGMRLVDELADAPGLRDHHLLPSVRGELLAQLGRGAEARTEFERAAALAGNARERGHLLERVRRS